MTSFTGRGQGFTTVDKPQYIKALYVQKGGESRGSHNMRDIILAELQSAFYRICRL